MFQTGVKKSFNARHFLRGDFADESVPHTHPYEVEIICGTSELDKNGFSVDIALLDDILLEVLDDLDSVLLNDLEYFTDRQPSLENLAVYIWESIRRELSAACRAEAGILPSGMEVRIHESAVAWASFSADIDRGGFGG